MDRVTGIFVEGIGAASATSGVLTQLQGRIFALLYLQPRPLSLEDIAAELEQSKSNVSVNIRGLADWHLVRRVQVPGSRKDHYEAATNLLRVMQQIMERRFRFNLRQVLATVEETERSAESVPRGGDSAETEVLRARLRALKLFFSVLDAGVDAFARGQPFDVKPLGQLFALGQTEPNPESELN
jgi:DNA-binding transcriptional regulator GbsR (MarR family)